MLVQRTVSYDPKCRRFKHVFGRSFYCRRLGNGVYRFKRVDGKLPEVVTGFVQIAAPWCEEKVDGLVAICSTHGGHMDNCPSDSENCKIERRVVGMNRWYAVMRLETGSRGARNYFDVVLLQKPPLRKFASKDPPVVPADGAGFHVMVFSES